MNCDVDRDATGPASCGNLEQRQQLETDKIRRFLNGHNQTLRRNCGSSADNRPTPLLKKSSLSWRERSSHTPSYDDCRLLESRFATAMLKRGSGSSCTINGRQRQPKQNVVRTFSLSLAGLGWVGRMDSAIEMDSSRCPQSICPTTGLSGENSTGH